MCKVLKKQKKSIAKSAKIADNLKNYINNS